MSGWLNAGARELLVVDVMQQHAPRGEVDRIGDDSLME